jgi:hypothetical protein
MNRIIAAGLALLLAGSAAAQSITGGGGGGLPIANPTYTGTLTGPTFRLTGSIQLGTGLMGYVANSTTACLGFQLGQLGTAPTVTLAAGVTPAVATAGVNATASSPSISSQTTTANGGVVCVTGFSTLITGALAVGITDYLKVQ